jgi:hypothetical protein
MSAPAEAATTATAVAAGASTATAPQAAPQEGAAT